VKHPFRQRGLAEILLSHGEVSAAQFEALGEGANGEKGDAPLAEALLRAGVLGEEALARALAEKFSLRLVDLSGYTVPAALFELIPAPEAYRLGVVPYVAPDDAEAAEATSSVSVVIADPFDLTLLERVERVAGRPLPPVLATRSAIEAALKRSQGSAEVLRELAGEFELVVSGENGGEDIEAAAVSLATLGDEASPVVKLINTLLVDALARRASDIHIEAGEQGVAVKYRIDGVLYSATGALDRRHHPALVSRLKVMAELDIAEKRVPQDGRFRLRLGTRDVDFRISVLPAVHGEDVVIRILDKSAITEGLRNLRLDSLGMAADVLRRFRRAVHEPYGMVLITGPTGSGKTTTLYAALGELNTGEDKIITIEDPVEYQLEGVVQIPVNEKKGLTFARGLRSVLRHDPDKIMVGEIRDAETAQIAVQSALTGHLVFTTVHANNAFDVIGRFAHMGIDVPNFISALNCVMAQRLVRLVCPRCRREVRGEPALLEQSGLDPRRYVDHVWHEGAGCEHCHGTGYRGRAAVTEFLDLTPRIRQMIGERRARAELQAAAVEEGMVTLRQSALAKALAGETTLREINRVTFVD